MADQQEFDLPYDPERIDPGHVEHMADRLADADVEARWSSRLAELFDVFVAHLRRQGRDDDSAAAEARRLVVLLSKHFGGRQWYLPRGADLDRALRDATIYKQMGRLPVEEIARQHGLTTSRVYQIHKEQGVLRLRKVQPGLF